MFINNTGLAVTINQVWQVCDSLCDIIKSAKENFEHEKKFIERFKRRTSRQN